MIESSATLASMSGAVFAKKSAKKLVKPKPSARNPDRMAPAASTQTGQNIVQGASPWPEWRCSLAKSDMSP